MSHRPEDRAARWLKAVFRVLKGKQLVPYIEDIDVERVHVQDPFGVVLLCGGPFGSLGDPTPKSLRDAFLKALPPTSLKERELMNAEDVTSNSDFFDSYGDLLVFETDLAQIVELIILFCESEGSLAELGAFAAIDEIMKRLFVVVNDRHWTSNSFIKLGPLRRIIREVGRHAILVISDTDVGLEGKSAAGVDKNKLKDSLEEPLRERLSIKRERTTFDKTRAGHRIKLIVGLIQEYGALTFEEIQHLLPKFNVTCSESDIRGYLKCATSVRWVQNIAKGTNDYFILTDNSIANGEDAATFYMKESSKETNKQRRRLLIREHWKKSDKCRYAAIIQSSGTRYV